MKRTILLGLLLLAACGAKQTLKPRSGASLPVKPATAATRPTPEKTIFPAGMPAARARRSSPLETTSAPSPSRASVASTAPLGLALTAKAISGSSIPASASRNTRTWRSIVAVE